MQVEQTLAASTDNAAVIFCWTAAVFFVLLRCNDRDEGNPTHPAVSGQLLGMDITLGGVTTLEVTSCFPMPLQTDAEDAEEGELSFG